MNILEVLRPKWQRASPDKKILLLIMLVVLLPVLFMFWFSYQLFRLELMIRDWLDDEPSMPAD